MADLDEIMESRPTGNEANEQQTTRDDGRDDRGRFAPGQARQQAEQDAQAHQPQDQQPAPDQGHVDPNKPPPGFIPQQAFDARMAKAEKQWQERYNAIEQQLNQFRQQQPQSRPQAEQKPLPDWWESPDAAFEARVQQVVSPIAQGQTSIVENFSRMMASDKHGEDAVRSAFADLQSRVQTNPAAMEATYTRIMKSPHPYGELVKWHKEQSALSTYGDDPEAWRTSERERMKAELLAEMQGGQPNGQQQAPQQQPQNMPNSFAGARNNGPRATPGFSGPKPLSEIMGGR
jgi:hypothetical protein